MEPPQNFFLFYGINDSLTYVITYMMQAPFTAITIFTNAAMDTLSLTLVFQLCAQFSVLSYQIQNTNFAWDKENIKLTKYVKRHQKLLR